MTGYWIIDWTCVVLLAGGVLRFALDIDLAAELTGMYDRWRERKARRAFERDTRAILRQSKITRPHYGAGEPEEE